MLFPTSFIFLTQDLTLTPSFWETLDGVSPPYLASSLPRSSVGGGGGGGLPARPPVLSRQVDNFIIECEELGVPPWDPRLKQFGWLGKEKTFNSFLARIPL